MSKPFSYTGRDFMPIRANLDAARLPDEQKPDYQEQLSPEYFIAKAKAISAASDRW